jgi:hypothetical protein
MPSQEYQLNSEYKRQPAGALANNYVIEAINTPPANTASFQYVATILGWLWDMSQQKARLAE